MVVAVREAREFARIFHGLILHRFAVGSELSLSQQIDSNRGCSRVE
jgi:hypothetical protein